MWYVPGKCPIPSNLSGYALMRSLVLSGCKLVKSFCTCWHSIVGFCWVGLFEWKLTAQFSSSILNFEHDGSPKIAGPGVSAIYHQVCSLLMTFFPSGFQSIAVSNVPYCLMVDPLQAVRHVLVGLVLLEFCGDMSSEQFTECTQWHNITTCASVNLAFKYCLLVRSYLSRHLDSCKCFCHSVNVYI